ncbi:MAG: O-antigen ligase family protein [Magnetospirillum sp.]|nr:O-antigen ligase family protein [Magnetospirillum sp.]
MGRSGVNLPPVAVVAVTVALAAFAAAMAAAALMPDQPLMLALPLVVAVAASLAPVGVALLAGERWAFVVALAVLLFVTDASFRARNWADKSWDWQVLMKGVVWLGCGVAGVMRMPSVLKLVAEPPGWLALTFLLIMAASSLWSPTPNYSFLASASFLMMFPFAFACADMLDDKDLLLAMALGCGAIVLPSLAIAPFAMGVSGTSPGSTGEPDRLRGLTDHPIPLAEISSLFTYACLALRVRSRRGGARFLLLVLGCAGAVTALLTHSRIPVMAMVASVLGFVSYRKGGALLMGPVLLVCAGLVLMMESVAGFANFLPRDLLELVSRSGSSNEILSLSGRLVIWPYAIDRIWDAPFLGHGHASGMEVFKGFAPWKITHAHNAYLQALLYVGLAGTLPLLGTLFAQLRMFMRRPEAPRDILLLYAMLSGITEQSMLSNMPSSSVILWMVAIGLAARAWPGEKAPSPLDDRGIDARLPRPTPKGKGAHRLVRARQHPEPP